MSDRLSEEKYAAGTRENNYCCRKCGSSRAGNPAEGRKAMENKKVRIEYLLSEAGRKKSLLAGGDGKELQVLEADITPELLERATVYQDGQAVWRIGYVATDAKITGTYDFSPFRLDVSGDFYAGHKPRIEKKSERVYFDGPQTVESLLAFVKTTEWRQAKKVTELETLLPEKIALWEKAVAEHKAKAAKAEADRKAREEAEKAEREQRKKEKVAWAAAHGSDYLKRCVALGYDCQRRYVIERAALEFPDYTVDFDGLARWKDRACPSEEALAEVARLIEQGHDAICVWATSPPYKMDNEDWADWDDGEAIVVHGYLGKYDLVKFI